MRHGIARFEDWQTKQGLTRQQSAAYQGAVEAALTVPIGAGLGWLCDQQFETEPFGLIVGVVFGFAAMLVRIIRMRPQATEDESESPDASPVDPHETADTRDPKP